MRDGFEEMRFLTDIAEANFITAGYFSHTERIWLILHSGAFFVENLFPLGYHKTNACRLIRRE